MYNILIKYNDSKKLWQLYGTTTSATSSEETFVPFETDDLEKLKTEIKTLDEKYGHENIKVVKDVANDIVRQTLMLINTTDDNDFTSFRAKDIDAFVEWYNEHVDEKNIIILKSALEFLDEKFEEKLNLKSTSLPMMLYAAYTCVKNEKDFDEFVNIVQTFVDSYGDNIDYVQYCTSGTSSAQSVKGRFNYWKNLCKGL